MDRRDPVSWVAVVVFLIASLASAGCSKKADNSNQMAQNNSSSAPAAGNSGANSGGSAGGSSANSQAASSAPATAPAPVTLTVPTGTTVDIVLGQTLSSATSQAGDPFQAALSSPITVAGQTVFPHNAAVKGTVVNAVSSGRLSRPAELGVTLTAIQAQDGTWYDVQTRPITSKGSSHKKRDIIAIGGGSAAGALIGGLVGHGKGAAIGALAGAGAVTAGAAATGKKEITMAAEAPLSFVLAQPVSVTMKGSN